MSVAYLLDSEHTVHQVNILFIAGSELFQQLCITYLFGNSSLYIHSTDTNFW